MAQAIENNEENGEWSKNRRIENAVRSKPADNERYKMEEARHFVSLMKKACATL